MARSGKARLAQRFAADHRRGERDVDGALTLDHGNEQPAVGAIVDMSITSPPSQTEFPATLWPPLRTESDIAFSRAKESAATTSAGLAQ